MLPILKVTCLKLAARVKCKPHFVEMMICEKQWLLLKDRFYCSVRYERSACGTLQAASHDAGKQQQIRHKCKTPMPAQLFNFLHV
jgi:hypothetical protein